LYKWIWWLIIYINCVVCSFVYRGLETQIPSVRLLRSWNPDPNYCPSVEVLKPRSRLSVYRGLLQQKFDRAWEGLYICRGGVGCGSSQVSRLIFMVIKIIKYLVISVVLKRVLKKTNIHLELSGTWRFFEVFSPTQIGGSLWFS
jgi:hypothetical protein